MKRLFVALVTGSTLITALASPAAEPAATAAKAPAAAKASPIAKKHYMTKAEIAAAQARLHDAAPADSYFGHMKLSYIGINNTFRDAMRLAGDSTTSGAIVSKVEAADEALHDFATRFPRDSALAQSYFLASHAQKKVWVQHNQERAKEYLKLLVSRYGETYFGKVTKKEIAGGITEHWYATAIACATPEPTLAPTASPEPTAVPSATPQPKRGRATPAPTPSPTPTVSPTPSPTPTPIPSPQLTSTPDGTKIVILPAACIPARTPSPRPSASPSPLPTPLMTGSPSTPATVSPSAAASSSALATPRPSASSTIPAALPTKTAHPRE